MPQPNTHYLANMRCPKCSSYGPFSIQCTAMYEVSDTSTEIQSSVDWDHCSFCQCHCGLTGDVDDFTEKQDGQADA